VRLRRRDGKNALSAKLRFPKNSLPLCAAKVRFQAIQDADGCFREPIGDEVISERPGLFSFGKIVVLEKTGQVAIQFHNSTKTNLICGEDFRIPISWDLRDTIVYVRSFLPSTDPSKPSVWTDEHQREMANMLVTAITWDLELKRYFRLAVEARYCQIWARVGSRQAESAEIAADIFTAYRDITWGDSQGGTAELAGEPTLYSIHVIATPRKKNSTLCPSDTRTVSGVTQRYSTSALTKFVCDRRDTIRNSGRYAGVEALLKETQTNFPGVSKRAAYTVIRKAVPDAERARGRNPQNRVSIASPN
jgi:hypothetical protein